LAVVETFGVDVTGAGAAGFAAGAGAGAGLGTVVGVVTFGTVTVVGVVDAPAGTTTANTLAAANTRPPVTAAMEERGFRLTVLLLLCMGYTDPL
jgi:hypothetical protein